MAAFDGLPLMQADSREMELEGGRGLALAALELALRRAGQLSYLDTISSSLAGDGVKWRLKTMMQPSAGPVLAGEEKKRSR